MSQSAILLFFVSRPSPHRADSHPESDLRIHDHISRQFVRKQARNPRFFFSGIC